MYRQVYADIITDIDAIQEMIEKGLSVNHQGGTLEVEARIGSVSQCDGAFVAGVSRVAMDELINLVESPLMTHSGDGQWSESVDYFVSHGGKQVRVSTEYAKDTCSMSVAAVIKHKIGCVKIFDAMSHKPGTKGVGARVVLSREQPVDLNTLPPVLQPDYVRIKQRRSFLVSCTADAAHSWRYDFTMTWGGATKSEAERAMREITPVYEIEIESPGEEFIKSHPLSYIATSIALKVADFVRTIEKSK